MNFLWKRTMSYDDIKDIYEAVIPECDLGNLTSNLITEINPVTNKLELNDTFLTSYPDIYRAYIATLPESNKIIACGVVGYLKKSDALYIDCWTLEKSIRGNKLSYSGFNSWLNFVKKDFLTQTNRLIIEVYVHNIILWQKIMNISILDIDNDVIKYRTITPNIIMGCGFESKNRCNTNI